MTLKQRKAPAICMTPSLDPRICELVRKMVNNTTGLCYDSYAWLVDPNGDVKEVRFKYHTQYGTYVALDTLQPRNATWLSVKKGFMVFGIRKDALLYAMDKKLASYSHHSVKAANLHWDIHLMRDELMSLEIQK